MEEKIKKILEKVKPFLINDGGNIEFIKYEEGIVYVKFLGACSHCPMMEMTLKDGIENALLTEIPEIKEVRSVE